MLLKCVAVASDVAMPGNLIRCSFRGLLFLIMDFDIVIQ